MVGFCGIRIYSVSRFHFFIRRESEGQIIHSMETIKEIIGYIFVSAGFATISYGIPYLMKRGWEEGKNDVNPKKKRVCDMCFRDIKRYNEYLEKQKKNT